VAQCAASIPALHSRGRWQQSSLESEGDDVHPWVLSAQGAGRATRKGGGGAMRRLAYGATDE
jgi:hypothetical protein